MESTLSNGNVTSDVNFLTMGWNTTETTGDTFMQEVKTYMEFKVANFINIYWYPILVPIGVLGNCLSFVVMMKPNNRKMSTCIYMAAISINDNLMMYVCFHVFLVSGLQIHTWHDFECKFLIIFCSLVALQNCTYLILAMTLDKYIAIKWPHKAATYSTPRRTKWIIVGLHICVFIYNVPHLFLSSTVGNMCVAYSNSSVISRMHSWFSFVLNAIIPFTLLIHMNYVIIKTIKNSRKMFTGNDKNTRIEAKRKTMKTAENQVSIMLLLVTTLFLILLGPTYIRFIYVAFVKRDTPFEYARSMLVFQITAKLYKTNSGINFLLYCISGQKFRNDLKEILCCSNVSNLLIYKRKDQTQADRTENTSVQTNTSK